MRKLKKRLGEYLGEKDDSTVIVTYGDLQRIRTLVSKGHCYRACGEIDSIMQYLDYTKE